MNTLTENTIILGDCVKVLPQIQSGSVNFILTDPPYMVNYKDRDGRYIQNDRNDTWLKPSFAEMYRVLANDSYCVSFYGWTMTDRFITAFRAAGFRISGHLAFIKRYASFSGHLRFQHENAYLLTKGRPEKPAAPISDVLEWKYTGNKLHPTQKPLSVLTPLIETFSAPGQLVLDPFAGSASTLVAARSLGRNYLGIEMDSQYHKLASERLALAGKEAEVRI